MHPAAAHTAPSPPRRARRLPVRAAFAAPAPLPVRAASGPRALRLAAPVCTASASPSPPPPPPPSASRRAVLRLATLSLATALLAPTTPAAAAAKPAVSSAYDLAPLKDGRPYALSALRGKVTLFVNVASYCALTPQYAGLVALHDAYQPRGFEVVASPCNQFGRQEPGSDAEVCAFARERYGARFLLLDKLAVNDGLPGGVAPLYRFLRDTSPERAGERVAWNFEKFLVGVDGTVLRRYKPGILPEDIERDVKFALEHPGQALPPKKKPSLGVQ